MPVVLLARHGQASFGAVDYDQLSDLGRRQAQLLGVELRRRGLRDPLVVSGSLRRQRDTAAIAAAVATPAAPVRVDPRWDEYDHLALLERFPSAADQQPPTSSREVQRRLDRALLAWTGETGPADRAGGWEAFRDGSRTALAELVADLGRGRDAVVFTSGGVVAALCAGLLDAGGATVVALNRVAVNGGLTQLLAGSTGVSVSSFNEHGYLPAADVSYR